MTLRTIWRGLMPLALVLTLSASVHGDAPPVPDVPLLTRIDDQRVALDVAAVQTVRQQPGAVAIRSLPIGQDQAVDLILERFSITTEQTRFVLGHRGHDDVDTDFDPDSVVLLRGHVDGHPGSRAFMAVSTSGAMGSFDLGPGGGMFAVVPDAPGQRGLTNTSLRVVRQTGMSGLPFEIACGVDDDPSWQITSVPEGTPPPGETRRIQIAIETDYEYYRLFDSHADASAYITALFGAVSDIYLRDVNTHLELTFVRLWPTSDDLFNEPDPLGPFASYWNDNMDDVERDVAQFVTGRNNLPYGGVAWVSALCTSSAYSVAGYILGSFADAEAPAFANWDIVVTAHELGHNAGTFHTHDYGIDGCAFGDIQRGTIMSYCHTSVGGNANIDLRLHTGIQPVIGAFLPVAECVDHDCNMNNVDDAIDIAKGTSNDADGDGIPDECQDCNNNGSLDAVDIAFGSSPDQNGNGVPDECEADCNGNGVPDSLDIALGTSIDAYGDGVPDECEMDCNGNGTSDYTELQADMNLDIDRNRVLDECQDCNDDGTSDFLDLDGSRNLWVATDVFKVAYEFDARSGVPVKPTNGTLTSDAQDLRIGSDGLVYITDGLSGNVQRFDSTTGLHVDTIVTGCSVPAGLEFDGASTLLVACRSDHSVLAFDTGTGASIGTLVPSGEGGLVEPFGLLMQDDHKLLVSTGDDRVLEFDGDTGAFLREVVTAGLGSLTDPRGMALRTNGQLLVASFGTSSILSYNITSGIFVGRFDIGGPPSGFWALYEPWSIRQGNDGYVYVSSHSGNTAIQRYDDATGIFKRSYYVLSQALPGATGFDIVPLSANDCNGNFIPDDCDVASGTSADFNSNGVPDECEDLCRADFDSSGAIDITDLLFLFTAWGTDNEYYDIAPPGGDGVVGVLDMLDVLGTWGDCQE